MGKRFLVWAVAPFVLLGALLVACGGSDSSSPTSPGEGVKAVERQQLQSAVSDKALGQTLELTRVIIPAGMDIAAHTHPGTQLAVVTEGTLTYTVIKGEVQVTHGAGKSDAKVETVKSGQSVQVQTGDSLVETVGMVHTAKNNGKGPVVIYLSALFPNGAAASSPAQ
jgi:quercetin dioxygenase-like cupin family protein